MQILRVSVSTAHFGLFKSKFVLPVILGDDVYN